MIHNSLGVGWTLKELNLNAFSTKLLCVCGVTACIRGFFDFLWNCDYLIAFQNSRGQRCQCLVLCQQSWVTCGKNIDQGRLIYVPAVFRILLWQGG
jgi:hypothetical protein